MSRRRALLVAVSLSAVVLLLGAESASASTLQPLSSTPTAIAAETPSPSPSPTESGGTTEKQDVERGVQREDLGFAGVMVVIGGFFMLTAGALGVLMVARERRRQDRAEATAQAERQEESAGV